MAFRLRQKRGDNPPQGHPRSKIPTMAGVESHTVNRELSALKRMLNLGAQKTPPEADRVPHIKMLKENNVRKGFFEHVDFLALTCAPGPISSIMFELLVKFNPQ